MQKGICSLSVVPMRRIPSDKSEMVSQLLYGETFTIIDAVENWVLIQNDFDMYEGWIDKRQSKILLQPEIDALTIEQPICCTKNISEIITDSENTMLVSFGSLIHSFSMNPLPVSESDSIHNYDFQQLNSPDRQKIIEYAHLFLNVPYLWGGKSFFGIDCSGFVQLVYKVAGFTLPRDAAQQMEHGSLISFIEQSEPADLAFFDNDEGQIVHIGIILSDNKIIHASGKIRIDSIDHYGIFNHELHRYTHRLRLIKRI